ncbi:MAG: YehR family protein, partial [Bacilli bacterium]|nr:YehR family protein [Bacilli bacterium]
LSLLALTMTACGDDTVKTMKCSRTMDQSGMKADFQYEVTYKGNDVVTVKTVEKMETSEENASALEAAKKSVEELYAEYNKLDHYSNKVEIDGNVLTSTTEIDYSKVDTDAMIKLDSANASLIKDGKVNVNDLKSMYEATGATCEK